MPDLLWWPSTPNRHMASGLCAVFLLACLQLPLLSALPQPSSSTASQACALLTSHTLLHTSSFSSIITDSVHDPDTTLSKLTGEVCLYCIAHIAPETAHRVVEKGLEHISELEIEGLLVYSEGKYRVQEADMRLTQEEKGILEVILRERHTKDEEFEGSQDYDSPVEAFKVPPSNWEL